MKLNTVAISLAFLSSSVLAEPWFNHDNWEFNPMVGMNIASEAHETAVPTILTYGAEIFYRNNYFVGASYGSNNKITERFGPYMESTFDEEFNRKSVWLGYKFDGGLGLKLGLTAQRVRSNYDERGTHWVPGVGYEGTIVPYEFSASNSYSTKYLMVGTGFYGEHLNMSVHYNIAASGEFNPYIKKSANNHLNIMIGYKF